VTQTTGRATATLTIRMTLIGILASTLLAVSSPQAFGSSSHSACLTATTAGCVINRTIIRNTLAASKGTACAVLGDGALNCWGSNSDGQRKAPAGYTFASVAVGGYHACAIKTDNSVVCWGDNHFRQSTVGGGTCTPDPLTSTSSKPCTEPASGPVGISAVDISAGKFHTCALRTDQTITCWGLNVDMDGRPAGQAVAPPGDFTRVSAGGYHTCAIAVNNSIVCWGGNWVGQATPPSGNDFKQVSAGRTHTCALTKSGSITCWGEKTNGRATPPSGTGFIAIAAAYDHTCAIRSNKSIVCWGANTKGQRNAPAGNFTTLAVGGDSGVGRRSDGVIVGWGDNSQGQTAIPVGSSIGGPSVTMSLLLGLGLGKWEVTVNVKAGTKTVTNVQLTSWVAKPDDNAVTTGMTAFATKLKWTGARPRWVRVQDSVGRWSTWAPVQPQAQI